MCGAGLSEMWPLGKDNKSIWKPIPQNSSALADVTICIGTFGSEEWVTLAEERALQSALDQTVQCEIIMSHDPESLADARNAAAETATTEFLIFLDADDELDPLYVESMIAGNADIRRPSTVGFIAGEQVGVPEMIPERNILKANYIIIGAMNRRQLFLDVGGFRDMPILEDWDLWLRMYLAGASIEAIHDAVYKIHIRENSRNQDQEILRVTYEQMRSHYRFER